MNETCQQKTCAITQVTRFHKRIQLLRLCGN